MQSLISNLKGGASKLLDFVFPWRCPLCGLLVQESGVCASCFSKMTFITGPTCRSCSLPLDLPPHLSEEEIICLQCERDPPPLKVLRSVFFYDPVSRPLILHLKYHRKFEITPLLASWLWGRGESLLKDVDALIPIPLHWWKLYRRTFNQTAILGKALAHKSGVLCLPNVLRKVRHTPPQASLDFKKRDENLKRAFAVPPKQKEKIRGKRLLLIDDVCTTGATLRAAAQALLKAGAHEVSALTLAYVDKRKLFNEPLNLK